MSKLSKLIKKHIEKKPKLKKTEKTVTKSRMFAQWLAENYPELRINSLEDNRGSNHVLGRAVDVAGIHNHKDKKKILKTALDIGLRVGKEVKGKKGVGGWTGAHYHFDENPELAGVHFTRGSETGNAVRKKRSKKENKENDKFVQEMNTLASKPKTIDVEEFTNKYKPRVKKYLKLLKGANSTSNLKELQKTIGTDPDGKFGKNTMRALINYVNKPEKAAPQSYEIKDIMGMDREEKMMSEENPSTAFSTNFDAKRRALQNKAQYSDMSFKDAFEQAMKDKGEGGIFDYKGKKILLKRAEPKKETKSFKDIISEYSSKEPEPVLEDLEEPVELDYGGNELMDREKELEELLKKRAAYKDGGVRYKAEDGILADPNIVSYKESGSDNDLDPVTEEDTDNLKIDAPEINTEASLEELPKAEPLEMEEPEEAGFMDKLGNMFSSEEESKKEQKPLTMESLEEKYNQLMEADAKERQTAGWATAAMHIASLIDKASAEPIGITPINFQAGDNRAEMQNLLAMGKMKGLGATGGDYSRDPNSEASKRARENARALGLKIPESMTEDEVRKLSPSLIGLKRTEAVAKNKERRQDKALGLQREKFERSKEEKDRPSDAQTEKIESLKFAQDLVKRTEELLPDVEEYLGPYASRIESASSLIPGVEQNEKFLRFKANAVENLASYIKDKSGAQVSDRERAFLEGALPSVTDKPGEFRAKLEEFKRRLKMVQEGRLGTIKAQGKNVEPFKQLLDSDALDDITEEDIDNMSIEELKKEGLY